MSLPRDGQTTTLSSTQAPAATLTPEHGRLPCRAWPEKSGLERLLNQTDCAGIRIYYGMHPDGQPALILVGVDAQGEELLDRELLEQNFPCPPVCPTGLSLRRART